MGLACGAGGVANTCGTALAFQCPPFGCPDSMTALHTAQITACTGSTCASPGTQMICVANTVLASVMVGCGIACPAGYQIAESVLDCFCQPYNYTICFPN